MDKKTAAEFWAWVDRQRKGQDKSWRELEIQAGVANGVVADRARAGERPTLTNMQAVSRGLGLPITEVLRAAGIIGDQDRHEEPTLGEILRLSVQLTVDERLALLRYIRFQYGDVTDAGALPEE